MDFTKEELRKHQTRYAGPWGREEQREGVESSQQFNDSHRLVQTCYIPGPSYILFIGFIIHIPCKEGITCHSHFTDEQSEAQRHWMPSCKGLSQQVNQDCSIPKPCFQLVTILNIEGTNRECEREKKTRSQLC